MEPEVEAERRVGTTLKNKWTLERLIGKGGMAAVYVAVHKIGRREAIKILYSDVAQDADLRARFEQEALAVNRFRHPGAVEIRDIDVAEDGCPFLVMELLEGSSLADIGRQPSGVPLDLLLRVADELLDVLVAAHAQGIIHRDIKPDNLFVLTDGRVKVLDFGIARVRAGASSKMRTRVGATLGTASYMPPEQVKGLEIDGRADLFAVGATMFRLLAKRRIHEATTETELLLKMATLPAPPLASVLPDISAEVAFVVDRALAFDRDHRYPDAAAMQLDVRAVRAGKLPPFASAPSTLSARSFGGSSQPGGASSAPMGPPPVDDPSLRTLPERTPASFASPAPISSLPDATRAGSTKAFAAPLPAIAPSLVAALPPPPSALPTSSMPAAVAPRSLVAAAQVAPPAPGSAAAERRVPVPKMSPPMGRPQPAPDSARTKRSMYEGGENTEASAQPVPTPRHPAPGHGIPVVPPTKGSARPGKQVALIQLVAVGALFAVIGIVIAIGYEASVRQGKEPAPRATSTAAEAPQTADTTGRSSRPPHVPSAQRPTGAGLTGPASSGPKGRH